MFECVWISVRMFVCVRERELLLYAHVRVYVCVFVCVVVLMCYDIYKKKIIFNHRGCTYIVSTQQQVLIDHSIVYIIF